MLTTLQTSKLKHYFNLLDHDQNGIVNEGDFKGVAENLCVLWGFDEGTLEFRKCISMCQELWGNFSSFIGKKDCANQAEWLLFADKVIVNGSELLYEKHVNKIATEVLELFDTDHDGYLSLNEYLDIFMAYRLAIRHSAKAFNKLDENKDDLLSKEEILEALRQFFRSDDEKAPGNWLFGFWELN